MKNITHHFNKKVKFSNASSRNLPLLILIGILWVVGCSSINKLTSSGGNSGSGGNQAPNTTKPTSSPVERPLQITQPRVLNYANLQFTLTKAIISNRIADELPIDNSKTDIVDLTFSVVNTLKDGVRIEGGLWQLKLGDGTIYKQKYSDVLEPRDTKERKISFQVPANSQWNGAQVTLDEQDKEPATLILEGNMPPPQFPVNIPTGTTETITKEPDQLSYLILKATLDEDAFGKRAPLGKRYLNLTVHVTDKGKSGGGGYFLPEYFRLLIDGTPSAPENSSESNLNSGGTQDYTMSYIVPANATKVELEVGKTGVQETAKIPINLQTSKTETRP